MSSFSQQPISTRQGRRHHDSRSIRFFTFLFIAVFIFLGYLVVAV